jgi:NAD dependent epimerase/dehydratase
MRVLVTGAEGFIGSHLVEALVDAGYEVRAFILYNSFSNWGWLDACGENVKASVEVVMGDVRDFGSIKSAIQGCDIVLNLAALIAIPYSYVSPESYIDTNIKGLLNVLNAARDCEVTQVIQTSTSEVYGTAQYVPIDEEHPLVGQSPYSASKIGADALAYSYYCSFGFPVSIIRPFNTYGPRQSNRAVIPTIITQCCNGLQTIRLGSLAPTRDFNFVEDTVSGFLSAISNENSFGQMINIGSGYEVSIEETVHTIADIIGVDIDIQTETHRLRPKKSEVERLLADNQKARKLLSWKPNYAGPEGFRNGLAKTIDWFQNPDNLSLYNSSIYNV